MSLRVLHVIPSVAVRDGGPSAAVVGMCRALRQRGVDARIATTDADGPGRLPVALGTWSTWEGVPTVFFRRWGGQALKLSPTLGRWLIREVGRHHVVHAHAVFSFAPVMAGHACRRAGVPLVVRPLGTLDPWSLSQKARRKQVTWWLAARRLLRCAAAVHYTTQAERRRAEQRLGLAGGVVIPLGVPEDLERLASDGEPPETLRGAPYALSLGRLHPKKGLERLIEAFLATAPAGVTLAIAGEGDPDYVARLRRFAGARGRGRVIFTGWLGGATKAATIAGAAIVVMASFQENFGISAAEAMSLGVPVVLTASVDLSEEVAPARAGWVTDASPGALTHALHEALTNDAARRERGARARDLARARFSWPSIAAELEALYHSLQASRR